MPQLTQAQRVQRIKELLAALNRQPPERHAVEELPSAGGQKLMCQVVRVGVDEVLLNPKSHRIRAQLEDDPEWGEHSHDPFGEPAQRLIERHVRAARKPDEFRALKDSLGREGQSDPGVMTHKGVMINANTRVVALRELENPDQRWVNAAVLPDTIQPPELTLLELRLQMRKELKVDYTLTNELLFIEELSVSRSMSNAQIALELRINAEDERKGAAEVAFRLQMLDLVRQMRQIPSAGVPMTLFDDLGYQQLRDAHRVYSNLVNDSPILARRYLESFLLSVAVGVTPVHQIRSIDHSFMGSYMVPQLDEEDDLVAQATCRLVAPIDTPAAPATRGLATLRGDRSAAPGPEDLDLRGLINAVTQTDHLVPIADSSTVLERNEVREVVKSAILTGIKEKRRNVAAEDKLEAPIEAVKAANKQLAKCLELFRAVKEDPEFDNSRRKSLEAAFKKLRRTTKSLETELVNAEITEN